MSTKTDWADWHEHYDDQDGSLARRLSVVRTRIEDTLAAREVRTILSLCAGDGRDVLDVLERHAPEPRRDVVLVELDPRLADAARKRADGSDVPALVVNGDAGDPATWNPVLPVDLLLLCGIFGNVPDADIVRTIHAGARMVEVGGTVIWTRGWFRDQPDLRPTIRLWFTQAGFEEVAYDQEPEGFGVGVNRLIRAPRPGPPLQERLFTFTR